MVCISQYYISSMAEIFVYFDICYFLAPKWVFVPYTHYHSINLYITYGKLEPRRVKKCIPISHKT